MKQEERIVYYSALKRTIKNRERRSSDNAIKTLKKELEDYADDIIEEAISLSEHAGRKTVKEKDVEKAINSVR